MTVEYSRKVATATRSIGFLKLLFRWKGSIYKVVWLMLTLYMMIFFFLSYMYHYILDREQQTVYEKLCVYCKKYLQSIPLSFILGFYVDTVMDRWWNQFTKIPWPDSIGMAVITSVKGTGEKSRLIRRTIMRYVNLAFVMTMQLCSPPCKERFPTWNHMVEAGFLLEQEKEIIEHLCDHTDEPKYWVPLVWAANVAAKARKEDKIYDDVSLNYLVKEINEFRTRCQVILCYDWICIPVVYTQVVTIALYLYFLCAVLARQFLETSEFVLDNEGKSFNMIVPIFLFIEFFFYVGWLNVAETMVNPFGSDDDDFEVNYLVDRHLKTSYAMVDDIASLMPEMAEDIYWNEKGGVELPYAQNQKFKKAETFQGSAAGEVVRPREGSFVVDVLPIGSGTKLQRFHSGSLLKAKKPSSGEVKVNNMVGSKARIAASRSDYYQKLRHPLADDHPKHPLADDYEQVLHRSDNVSSGINSPLHDYLAENGTHPPRRDMMTNNFKQSPNNGWAELTKTNTKDGLVQTNTTENLQLKLPSNSVKEPNNTLKDPTATSATLKEPTTTLKEPTTTLKEPITTLKEPTTTLKGPTTTLKEPTTTLKEPTTTLKEPNTTLKEPTTTLKEPNTTLKEPNTTLKEPNTTLKEPTNTLKEPTTTLKEPTNTLKGPSNTLKGPINTVKGQNNTVKGPSYTVKGQNNTAKGPSNTAKGPNNTAKGANNTAKGPSNTLKGPSNTLKTGLNTTAIKIDNKQNNPKKEGPPSIDNSKSAGKSQTPGPSNKSPDNPLPPTEPPPEYFQTSTTLLINSIKSTFTKPSDT